ncbi:MAG TPA: glycosyltransferase [Pyrinomonadaceae bacterium]|nr:glycosyltransferase [Pyrinomonadaceae bacterium]
MIIAFRSLFGSQYEGGANWQEVTLASLCMLPQPPKCLVLDAAPETLPETLRHAAHVEAVPLPRIVESRSVRAYKRLARRVQGRSWENPNLTHIAARYKIDLWVGFAAFDGLGTHRPLVICYPDFQFRYFPELFERGEVEERERQWSYVAEHARGIFTISEATAADALRSHPQIKDKLYVCGFPPVFKPEQLTLDPGEVRRKYSLPERFFLVSNQFWEHKNHLLVFRALHHLKERGRTPPVVAFTGRPYDQRRPEAFTRMLMFVHAHGLHEYCRFLGVLPRDEQIALIRSAEAVVQPSKFEGRGAITEEACLLGTQLLCSDLPTHRELDLPGAIFFDVDAVGELAELLERDYTHIDRDAHAVAAESRRLSRLYGERLLKVFESVLQTPDTLPHPKPLASPTQEETG